MCFILVAYNLSLLYSLPCIIASCPTEPTFDDLLCVNFLYGLTNEKGFDASDIFDMVNNTFRTGLEVATRAITIRVLNETFPQRRFAPLITDHQVDVVEHDVNVPVLKGHRARAHGGTRRRHLMEKVQEAVEYAALDLYGTSTFATRRIRQELEAWKTAPTSVDVLHDLPKESSTPHFRGSRRLVFFTDQVPVEIDRIVDNMMCEQTTELSRCAIVSSTVCIVLEGEVSTDVRSALLLGIRVAIRDGDFEAAIPTEHAV